METPRELEAQLTKILGSATELTPRERVGLPAYLARAYNFWGGDLLGREALFAIARPERVELTAKRIEGDARALQAVAQELVVIVLPHVEAHVRRRLIERRVPFMVPGKQLFLPRIGVDLLEIALGPKRELAEQLGWASQVTILRHILWKDVEARSLRKVATALGYSAMALSNARRQLVAAALATVVTKGRAHTLRFEGAPHELWDAALPHLRTPVRRRVAVRLVGEPLEEVQAGLSALSQLTEIAAAPIPTIAMSHGAAAAAEECGQIEACPNEDEADRFIEVWNYDPGVLAAGRCVDPLSLYLSLRDDPDARTEQAVERLVEEIRW